MAIFKPCKIVDPKTGEEQIISAEEQEEMLEKGIVLDVPCAPIEKGAPNQPTDKNDARTV